MSFLNKIWRSNNATSHRRRRRHLRFEHLHARQLLAGDVANDDLAALSDEFDVAANIGDWQRLHEVEGWNADQLQVWNVDQTQPGRMVMQPHTVVWYENWRGPMAFKQVTGNFVFTSEIVLTDRDEIGDSDGDDVPDDAAFSLGGIMIRTPREIENPATDWALGTQQDDGTNQGENYVFLSMGHGTDGQFSFEVKTTRNSQSNLELTPLGMQVNTATLRIARIDDAIVTMYRLPGEDWTVHRRYARPDMPATLQLGLVTYSDWNKASDFDPFTHNATVLQPGVADPTPAEPFNPDLVAGFEFARFARPVVPNELAEVDLVNDASPEQLLSFLGDPAEGDNMAPQVAAIEDQTLLVEEGPLILDISASDTDGDALEMSVHVLGSGLTQLVAEHNLHEMAWRDDFALNWGGENEKWLQGNEGWYFLLPNGTLNLWQDTFENSEVLATISTAQYDDPHLLLNAAEPDLHVELVGQQIFVTAGQQIDQFDVELQVADETSSTNVRFVVEVINTAPIVQIVNQETVAGQSSVMNLPAEDADGHTLSYAVAILGDELGALDEQHGFWANGGQYYTNYLGESERWIRDSQNHWHYLLPTGALHRWEGSFAGSPLLASLGTDVYDDPARLTDPVEVPVEATIVDNVLTITGSADYIGEVLFELTITDGYQTHVTTFHVSFVSDEDEED